MRPASHAELAGLPVPGLENWIRASIFAWADARTVDVRALAFDPLFIPPNEHPARFVAQWWLGADGDARQRMAAAISGVIETLEPSAAPSATLLAFGLALHFDSTRKLEPIYAYLSRPPRATGVYRRDLSEAIAHLARRRGGSAEACDLAYRLRDVRLFEPVAAIELLTYAAIHLGRQITIHLRTLLPSLFDGEFLTTPSSSSLYRYFANTLVDTVGPAKALEIGLAAQDQMTDQVRLALEMFRLEVPTTESPIASGQAVILTDLLTHEKTAYFPDADAAGLLSVSFQGSVLQISNMAKLSDHFEAYSVETLLGLQPSPGRTGPVK